MTNSFKQILVANGIPERRIAVIRNAVDLSAFAPGPKPVDLAKRLELEGKFVAAYVGTIGMAHGLGVLLSAAETLRDHKDLVFVLVGTGAERARLEDEAKRRGLRNVIFVGPVDKEDVRAYWRLCDVALVLLRDTPVFETVIPSKMFEAMGTGRPMILGVRGESEALLREAGAGIPIPPEDPVALAQAIERMIDNPGERREMGAAARAFVERKFDRSKLALEMLGVLEEASLQHRSKAA